MSTDFKSYLNTDTEEEAIQQLYKLYLEGASTTEIGDTMGVTDVTIRRLFKKYHLNLKPQGGNYKGKSITITEQEYKLYTTKQLIALKGCSQFTIYQLTKNYPSKRGRKKVYSSL
jgi:hypothetical protein